MVERPFGPVADLAALDDQLGGADQRIAPAFHGRRAGMALHAGPRDLVPALALRAGDDADRLVLPLEDRPLLDMRLEEGADRPAADRLLAVIADLLQRLAEAHAVAVLDAERMLQREGAAEHARGHHGRREAAALLVGPHRDLDRRLGDVARIVQHAQHLEPRHHAIGAVELAAGRLGVEMRAGHHRRLGRIAALAAGEDVAELVDLDGAARRLGPAHEEVAALAGRGRSARCGRRRPSPCRRSRPAPSGSTTGGRSRSSGWGGRRFSWQLRQR